MAVAGLLAQYMSIKSQLSYVELQDTRWNDLATAMSKKLSEQENYQSKWEDNSGKVDDVWDRESTTFTYKGETYWDGGKYQTAGSDRSQKYKREEACTKYAFAKVPKYNPDKLDEYTDLDMEYSTMVAMYDTLLEELQAQADGIKTQLSTEAQDNHMLGQ